jgi:hypothetical protein
MQLTPLLSKIIVSWTGWSWIGAATRAYRKHLGEEALCTVSHIMVTSLRSKWTVGAIRRGIFRRVFATCGTVGTRSRAIRGSTPNDRVGCNSSDGRCAPARPALQRRCMSRRLFCRFCHARSPVPIVFGPFHYCAFCERAAPETIDDQRRCTERRYRTIYGGSRGSASLPRRRSGSVLSLLQCIPTIQL